MSQAHKEIIRESHPNTERTVALAEAMDTEFDRLIELDVEKEERTERMDIEGAIAALAFDRGAEYESVEQRQLLLHLADKHGSIAEDRRMLKDQIYTNDLTGLKNNRAFEIALKNTERDNTKSYISMDMNDFGEINKRVGLGWTAGNQALKYVADHLRAVAQKFGVQERDVFHLHGDEFSMIVPADIAERILADIEETFGENEDGQQTYASEDGAVNTSITGVAVSSWEEADDALNAKKRAKKAEK